jgi:hypothetical protein
VTIAEFQAIMPVKVGNGTVGDLSNILPAGDGEEWV